MNLHNWFVVAFCAIATLLSVSYGWLVKQGKLPFNSVMAFNDVQRQFIEVWAKIALLVGVIVPIVMWIVFWEQPVLRTFFSYYLLVVAVQLASEISFSRIYVKSVVVIIGTLYTGFRLWQLWAGLHSFNYPQPWLGLLWLVFIFWVANIIMLTFMAIPSIFPKSDDYSLSSGESD
jgi:hypothetical protein